VIITKVRKLVQRDKVHLLHAVLHSGAAYAVRDIVQSEGVPWVTVAASAGLTRDKASPYVFRFVPSTFQWAYAPVKWLKEKQGWQKIIWIFSRAGQDADRGSHGASQFR
jgi:ABC-type branched-subunit amino acid transport system substrate-binding protein